MTQARLRECHKCKSKFYKTEGCNKMTCGCGALMCYICREKIDPKVGYKHFCQHPRDPGKACAQCVKCSLFTNTEQDDEMAINEVRKQEEAKLAAEGGDSLKRPIGPPPENPAKKPKIGGPLPPIAQLGFPFPQPVMFPGQNLFHPGVMPPPQPRPPMFARQRRRGRRG